VSSAKERTKLRFFQKRMSRENVRLRNEFKNALKICKMHLIFYSFLDNIGWSKHEVPDGLISMSEYFTGKYIRNSLLVKQSSCVFSAKERTKLRFFQKRMSRENICLRNELKSALKIAKCF
jgi:hypothetical protein